MRRRWPAMRRRWRRLQAQIGARPVLLAAQTHPGEDETVLPAHDMLRARFPDLAHHHRAAPSRARPPISKCCAAHAPSSAAPPGRPISAADPGLYRRHAGRAGLVLSPGAVLLSVGGTLVPMGGHNPLEPAVLERAVLAGPHRASAVTAYEAILGAQGFGGVASSGDIAREAARLFGDPDGAACSRRCGGARRGHPGGRGGAHASRCCKLCCMTMRAPEFWQRRGRRRSSAGAAGRSVWRQRRRARRALARPYRARAQSASASAISPPAAAARRRWRLPLAEMLAGARQESFLSHPRLWRQRTRPAAGAGGPQRGAGGRRSLAAGAHRAHHRGARPRGRRGAGRQRGAPRSS